MHEFHNHTDSAWMDPVPGTQMILADNYVHGISTHISTVAEFLHRSYVYI